MRAQEMEHRAKLRRKAVLNQAESVVEAVEPRVVDELLAQACGQYAAMFNDRVEEVFIDVVNGVQVGATASSSPSHTQPSRRGLEDLGPTD